MADWEFQNLHEESSIAFNPTLNVVSVGYYLIFADGNIASVTTI